MLIHYTKVNDNNDNDYNDFIKLEGKNSNNHRIKKTK